MRETRMGRLINAQGNIFLAINTLSYLVPVQGEARELVDTIKTNTRAIFNLIIEIAREEKEL